MKKCRQGNIGMGVDAADPRGCFKSPVGPGNAIRSYIVGIYQMGAAERAFHRGKLERGSVGDIDHLSRSRALVGLIQPSQEAQSVSVPIFAEKSVGADLRVDGLQGKTFGERRTKQIRAEIVNREHPAKTLRQLDRSVGSHFLATLVLPRVGLPLGGALLVNDSEIFGLELVLIADRAKDPVLRPSPC